MNNLQHYIAELLQTHDCVIVPGFGGFIGNYEPAFVNRSASIIFPPAKQVLFNPNLTKNDGLLANYVAGTEGISYTAALEKITGCIYEWKKNLEAGQRVELGEMGFLFTQGNKVLFEQNRETNLLLQSYGLKQVSFTDFSIKSVTPVKTALKETNNREEKPVIKLVTPGIEKTVVAEKVEETSEQEQAETVVIALDTAAAIEEVATEEDPKVIPIKGGRIKTEKPVRKNTRYKYMAAAVALPVLFYSYWIPMRTDALSTGKIQVADFNPMRSQAKRSYEPRTSAFSYEAGQPWKSWEDLTANLPAEVSVYSYELDEETYIPVLLERENAVAESTSSEGFYHVIANCFGVKRNAEKFVEDLISKGYKASIVGKHNGLYRVSSGAYQTEQQAESALDALKGNGYSGWILEP